MAGNRVLIVEDDPLVAADLRARLGGLKYLVVGEARTCAEAIRLSGQVNPEIVLMDIRLESGADGIEASQTIRRLHDLPIVFTTAFADDATIARASGTNPYGYIVKPIENRELRAAIEVALQHHKSESALRKMERWLATTLQSIGDAVISTDTEGRVTFLNRVAEDLSGWSLEQARGLDVHEVARFLVSPGGPPHPSPFRRALAENVVIDLLPGTVLVRRDGREVAVEDSAAPIRDDEGRVTGVVVIFRDVSENRRVQQELERVSASLREAQKLEALGRLAGGIAHDFKNMMMIVKGFAELLAASPVLPSSLADHVLQVRRAAESGTRLTQQLLAFSRQQVLQPHVINLAEFLERIRPMLEVTVGVAVKLAIAVDADAVSVLIDPGQMEQVMVNLVVNAREAMPAGGVLSIRTRAIEKSAPADCQPPGNLQDKSLAMLEVSDTGVGMNEATLARAFDPFFTTRRDTGGTGLGLSIVHGIVSQSGGAIDVQSTPGSGTRFRIWLPRVDSTKAPAEIPAAADGRGREGCVLLVEDNEAVRHLVETILTTAGYHVCSAGSGQAALALAQNSQTVIDLLLTDVAMPGMTGPELAAEIRKTRSNLPVIFMSGYSELAVSGQGVIPGGAGFIEKPFASSDLLKLIRATLG